MSTPFRGSQVRDVLAGCLRTFAAAGTPLPWIRRAVTDLAADGPLWIDLLELAGKNPVRTSGRPDEQGAPPP